MESERTSRLQALASTPGGTDLPRAFTAAESEIRQKLAAILTPEELVTYDLTTSPNRAPERQGTPIVVGLRVNGRDIIQPFPATLTDSNVRQVSTDASVDNISVWTTTPAGYFEARVPVLRRPAQPRLAGF